MSSPDVVQVVLYTDYDMGFGWTERVEHHVMGLSEAQVDLVDRMGLGTSLLFPQGHGTAVAVAMAARIDSVLGSWRVERTTPLNLSLMTRLRALSHECRQRPRAELMARTV